MFNSLQEMVASDPKYNDALFKLQIIEAGLGQPLTDEQKMFALDFTRDIITFANPGTGKTHTLTAGILMAQSYWQILSSNIFCMSYTNAATNEIKGRHKVLAKKMKVPTSVEFGTFHSLSKKILQSAYPDMQVVDKYNDQAAVEDMTTYIHQVAPEYSFDNKQVWKILRVINELNSSFTFTDENVATKYSFTNLGIELDKFQELRRKWFGHGLILGKITQGDIPLYCLYALIKKPNIAAEWIGKYEIMIVDEFQDLSLLDLEILSRVAKKLIVVGDMKQQIYVFSGACPEIVDAYKRTRPNAFECYLTQSFRCPQPIADLANKIIAPNLKEDPKFIGRPTLKPITESECIEIKNRKDLDWKEIFKDMSNEKLNSILILYRNNASTIPVIEELYSRKIPFRCPKFARVMDIPVLSTMCKLVDAAWHPNDRMLVEEALKVFPEFRFNRYNISTYTSIMAKSNKTIFDLEYLFEQGSSKEILSAMREAANRINNKKSAGNVIVAVRDAYKKFIQRYEYYPNEETYYYNMVAPIANIMTYPEMVNHENDKLQQSQYCLSADLGVRCYTMHSSKGLEADNVYLLDVNEGIFPNAEVLKKKHEAGCDYDCSLDVRSERNLLYVAVTRAKQHLTISFSNEQLATLLSDPDRNVYRYYDGIYETEHQLYDDLAGFTKVLVEDR